MQGSLAALTHSASSVAASLKPCPTSLPGRNQCLVHVSYQAYESEYSFLLTPLSLPYEITFEYLMRMYYIIGFGIYIQCISTNCQKVLYQNSFRFWGAKKTKSCPHRTHVWFHESSFHGFKSSHSFTSASK